MDKIAIYAGSFNPWHKGHQYVYEEGMKLFGHIIVVKAINPEKQNQMALKSRMPLYAILPEGQALGNFAKEKAIDYFIRGIRNTSDYDYEFKLAVMNKDIFDIRTIFIPCDPSLSHINSSMLRELNKLNVDIKDYLVTK